MMRKFLWKNPPAKLFISRSEIHIWKECLRAAFEKNKHRLVLLSGDENKRLGSFKFEKDRICYAITHSLKRWIIAKYLNTSPESLIFRLNQQGKPAISAQQNWLNLQFNISHSHQLILIALTLEDPIGIDLEYHSDNISIENLRNFIFSSSEKYSFSKISTKKEKNEAFFRCWTRKEAYLKAEGIGLMDFPNKISVDISEKPSDNWLENLTMNKNENSSWKLFPLNIDKHYTASVVCANYPKRLVGYKALSTMFKVKAHVL